jgi:carboxyl-terminal processing protease
MLLYLLIVCAIVFIAWVWVNVQHQSTPAYDYEQIWNKLNEQLYDPTQLQPWETWRERHLHKLTGRAEVVKYANEMLEPLHDPYTIVISPEQDGTDVNWDTFNFVGVGVSIATAYQDVSQEACAAASARTGASCRYPTITGVTHNSPAAAAGLKATDVITAIDGWDTAGKPLGEVMQRLRGQDKDRGYVTLTVERNGVRNSFRLKRDYLKVPTAWSRMIGDDIGYLRIANFSFWSEEYAVRAAWALAKAKAIIVDVRDNPGGELIKGIRLCALFMHEGYVTTTHQRQGGTDLYKTAHFKISRSGLMQEVDGMVDYVDTPNLPASMFAGLPLVVLVNENTASSAELFTGGISESAGATIIGAQSFGKGVCQLAFSLPDGNRLKVTTGRFYTPSGHWLGDGSRNRHGFQPHIVVTTQSKLFDMGSDDDETVSEAVNHLRKRLAS